MCVCDYSCMSEDVCLHVCNVCCVCFVVCYHQAPVANCRSWVSWQWERKQGVPPHSASWCFPRCWEGSGCADHTGTQCCDYPARGNTNVIFLMSEKKKSVCEWVCKFVCMWLDVHIRLIWDFRIKEKSGLSISGVSSLPEPADHSDMSDGLVIPQWQHWHPTDGSTSVQISIRSTPLWVGVHACVTERQPRKQREGTCTQITCEREWMWQLWHTHDRGNAANCLSDSLSPTAGLCGRGRRRRLGGKGGIHSPWQTGLAVIYSLCMSVLSVCPSVKVMWSVWVANLQWVAFSLPACILLSCLCVCVCFSNLYSVYSDL